MYDPRPPMADAPDDPLNDPAWLREKYIDRELTGGAIAKALGCSHDSVYAALMRHDIPRRARGRRRITSGPKFPELHDKVWLHEQVVTAGKTTAEIAETVGCSRQAVQQALRRLHINQGATRGANTPAASPAAGSVTGDTIALLRRALIRLNTVEQRLAALEERQHDLDDMAEQIRGLQKLVRAPAAYDDQRIRTIVQNTVDKRLKQAGTFK